MDATDLKLLAALQRRADMTAQELGEHLNLSPSQAARRRARLEAQGMSFCGLSPDGLLPETVEYPDHPWFIGVQYHPELKSRPFEPHPLFSSFIGAAVERSRLV